VVEFDIYPIGLFLLITTAMKLKGHITIQRSTKYKQLHIS